MKELLKILGGGVVVNAAWDWIIKPLTESVRGSAAGMLASYRDSAVPKATAMIGTNGTYPIDQLIFSLCMLTVVGIFLWWSSSRLQARLDLKQNSPTTTRSSVGAFPAGILGLVLEE